jgi:hypothetical protein
LSEEYYPRWVIVSAQSDIKRVTGISVTGQSSITNSGLNKLSAKVELSFKQEKLREKSFLTMGGM